MRVFCKILLIITLILAESGISFAQNPIKAKPLTALSSKSANENAPVLTREGMVFTSDMKTGSYQSRTGRNGQPISHLYFSELNENGNWGPIRKFSENIWDQHNQASISFNFNEDMAVFTRNYESAVPIGNAKNINPNFGLYFIDFDGNNWSSPREFEHNDHEYNYIHPTLSPMSDLMYFSSNMPGGFGGYDLYLSRFQNGVWSAPENLGPVVNTSGNELYPFLHASGRLYFSSNSHDNRADYDIFYTDFFENRWFRPVKLRTPYNSGSDDFSFIVNEDFTAGFFTTRRRGSVDIWSFESTFPKFDICKQQVKDNYCYVFFEENTVSLDTNLYVYEWNMGDGTKVMATEAQHCYTGPGNYLVELNVVDRLTGIVEFNQAEYLVEVRKVIQPFISGPDTVLVNQEIQLYGTESYLGDAEPGEFYWDFGDGQKETGATVRHIFETPGSFTLKLGIIEDSNDPETARQFCSYKSIVVKEE